MEYFVCKRKFIDFVKTYCSSDTVIFYCNCFIPFRKFLIFKYSTFNIDMNNIDSGLISDYILFLRTTGVKNVTVRTYMRGLRVFINYCNMYLGTNIIINYKLPKDDSSIKIPLSNYEVSKILDSFSDSELRERNELIILLMLNCGLRLQEVVNLRCDDIFYDRSLLVVRDSKNNKSRLIPIPQFLLLKLARFGSKRKGFYFTSINNSPMSKTLVKNIFYKLKKVCPRIHAHLLRHTFATSYIMGGGSLECLRVLLGHSSYSVTQEYISSATELSLCKYDIYKLDKTMFDNFTYWR